MNKHGAACVAILSLSLCGKLGAQTNLATRGDLDSVLGASAVTESFEGLGVGLGGSDNFQVDTLNSTTDLGSGPGLVIPGFTLSASSSDTFLQWSGAGYFNLPSATAEMYDQSSTTNITEAIQFTAPVTAFGVDLEGFDGFPGVATATVYAPDDTTVLEVIDNIDIAGGAGTTFLGVSDASGIGEVTLTQNYSWAPLLDNLEFGTAANVPDGVSTALLLGVAALGLVGTRFPRRAPVAAR